MDVLVVEPGYAPYEKSINDLEDMQAIVGGTIQGIYPFQDNVAVVCNDDAKMLGMEFNRSVPGGYGGIRGPFFVCGTGEEDFCSLTPEQMEKYKKYFHHAELLVGVSAYTAHTLKVEPKKKRIPGTQSKSPKRPER